MDLFAALDHLWEELAAHRSQPTLRRWSGPEPVMGCFDHLDQLVEVAQAGTTDWRRDMSLAALSRLARTDQTAQLTALRIMRPGLIRLDRVYGHDLDWDDAHADLVARALHVFVHSGSRPGAVLMRLRNDLGRQRARRRSLQAALGERVHAETELLVPPSSTARAEVVELLQSAIDRGHITRRDAQIIVMTRLGGTGTESAAAAIGIHAATLRRARNRAETALAAFARGELREEVA